MRKTLSAVTPAKDEETSSIIQFLMLALDSRIKGDSVNYLYVVSQLQNKKDVNLMTKLCNGLNECVVKILSAPAVFQDMLRIIFAIDVPRTPQGVSLGHAVSRFIVSLVSANNYYLSQGLEFLVRHFKINGELSSEELLALKPQAGYADPKMQWIHDCIATLTYIAPLTSGKLVQVITDAFPHKRIGVYETVTFINQTLMVVAKYPSLRLILLRLVIRKMIDIDVEIELEEMMPAADSSSGVVAVDEATQEAEKMDHCMMAMFLYIDAECEKGQEDTEALFLTLLDVFESCILLTHRSKFTQFIIFYIARLSRRYGDELVGRLINKVTAVDVAPVTRISASAYVASFLGRAAFVMGSTLRSAIYYLMDWVLAYADAVSEKRLASPDTDVLNSYNHTVFYSAVQCIAYIICFKGDRISETGDGEAFLHQWKWDLLLHSSLDPMRYCLSTVRTEFLRKMMSLKLLPDDVVNRLLDRFRASGESRFSVSTPMKHDSSGDSKYSFEDEGHFPFDSDFHMTSHTPSATSSPRAPKGTIGTDGSGSAAGVSMKVDTSTGGMGSCDNPLDSFFPFDPYLLCRSYRFIEKLYQTWNGTSGYSEYDDAWEENEATEALLNSSPLIDGVAGMSLTPTSSGPSSMKLDDGFHQVVFSSGHASDGSSGGGGSVSGLKMSFSEPSSFLDEKERLRNLNKFTTRIAKDEPDSGSW